MKSRTVKVWLRSHEARPVRILADAAVSTQGVLGGRLVPLVILDTSDRPDIEELIRLHDKTLTPGDVTTQWADIKGHEGTVALILSFIRPFEGTVILEFDILRQGILVEQALTGKGLYIQAGRDGDRFIKDPGRPKVLLEIHDKGYGKAWDTLFHKHLEKDFRKKGLNRSDSRRAARGAIEELRKFSSFRIRESPP